MIKFEILGKPTGKGRPRLGRYGTYTPTKTVNYENLVKYAFMSEYKDFKPLEGALSVHIVAVFEVPKSYSKKKRNELLNENYFHTKKPDCDNITKIILDSLNGLAYKDDSQVSSVIINKIYGEQAKVYVTISEL